MCPNPYIREILLGQDQLANQAADAKNMELRDQTALVISNLAQGIVTAQDDVAEPLTSDNRLMLLAGTFTGITLRKPNTTLLGQPGAIIVGPMNLYAGSTFTNIDFIGKSNLAIAYLTESATPVVFQGCTFTKTQGIGGDYIVMSAGAKAVFIGCKFFGNQTTDFVVNNAGLASDVGIVGCYNGTGRTYQNATIVFEVS